MAWLRAAGGATLIVVSLMYLVCVAAMTPSKKVLRGGEAGV